MLFERKIFVAVVFCLTLLGVAAVYGQNKSPLIYSARKTLYKKINDDLFKKWLSGDVRVVHLDAELTADEGVYSSNPSEIKVYGGAAYRDSVRKLNADTLIYRENNREALAVGNVIVTEGGRLLGADRVRYLKNIRFIGAYGNVTISDDSTKSIVRGQEAAFNDSTGYGLITGNPILEKTDESGNIVTVTCSDTLEVLQEEKTFRLWNNVVAVKDSFTTYSDRAVYNNATETLVLTGNPRIEYLTASKREGAPSILTTRSIVTGDTVSVRFSERKVVSAEVKGSAVSSTSSIDTMGVLYDRSVIESMVMRLGMENDLISTISAEGTARSYYHRNYSEDKNMFVNVATGDTLNFLFENGDVSSMEIYGYGGSPGKGMYYEYEDKKAAAAKDSVEADSGSRGVK